MTAPSVTVARAAEILGVSPQRVRKLLADGVLTFEWGEGKRMIPAAEVRARMKSKPKGGRPKGSKNKKTTTAQERLMAALGENLE